MNSVRTMTMLYSNRTRSHISCALFLLSAIPLLGSWTAGSVNSPVPEYRLRLYHTHTNERIDLVYRRGDTYVPDAIAKLDYFLRDHRTGDVHHYDPRVFDLLEDLTSAVGHADQEIDIICGYRTPWSNNFLRTHSSGVAEHSLHMLAEAIDIRMPGVDTYKLREAALSLHRGGVGYYPQSDFVHVDVGPVRHWCLGCTAKEVAGN